MLRQFHFVFGLRPQHTPFHLLHYLSLLSCMAVNRPYAVHMHLHNEPYGPWWERIRPALTVHRIAELPREHRRERYAASGEGRLIAALGLDYAHAADFVRLDVLLAHGGAYADIDTLFVRPYPDAWFSADCVIGEENAPQVPGRILRPSLCNAVLVARPASRFLGLWRARMGEAFDGSWDTHSCALAAQLWREQPALPQVQPRSAFYHWGSSRAGLAALLEDSDALPDAVYSVHLWEHLWWSRQRTDFSTVCAEDIDEAWLRTRDCTLARLARPFLDHDPLTCLREAAITPLRTPAEG